MLLAVCDQFYYTIFSKACNATCDDDFYDAKYIFSSIININYFYMAYIAKHIIMYNID